MRVWKRVKVFKNLQLLQHYNSLDKPQLSHLYRSFALCVWKHLSCLSRTFWRRISVARLGYKWNHNRFLFDNVDSALELEASTTILLYNEDLSCSGTWIKQNVFICSRVMQTWFDVLAQTVSYLCQCCEKPLGVSESYWIWTCMWSQLFTMLFTHLWRTKSRCASTTGECYHSYNVQQQIRSVAQTACDLILLFDFAQK